MSESSDTHKYTQEVYFDGLISNSEYESKEFRNKGEKLENGFYLVVKASRYADVWAVFSVDSPCNSRNVEYFAKRIFNYPFADTKDQYIQILTDRIMGKRTDGVMSKYDETCIQQAKDIFDKNGNSACASDFYAYEFMQADKLGARVYEAYCEH